MQETLYAEFSRTFPSQSNKSYSLHNFTPAVGKILKPFTPFFQRLLYLFRENFPVRRTL